MFAINQGNNLAFKQRRNQTYQDSRIVIYEISNKVKTASNKVGLKFGTISRVLHGVQKF